MEWKESDRIQKKPREAGKKMVFIKWRGLQLEPEDIIISIRKLKGVDLGEEIINSI